MNLETDVNENALAIAREVKLRYFNRNFQDADRILINAARSGLTPKNLSGVLSYIKRELSKNNKELPIVFDWRSHLSLIECELKEEIQAYEANKAEIALENDRLIQLAEQNAKTKHQRGITLLSNIKRALYKCYIIRVQLEPLNDEHENEICQAFDKLSSIPPHAIKSSVELVIHKEENKIDIALAEILGSNDSTIPLNENEKNKAFIRNLYARRAERLLLEWLRHRYNSGKVYDLSVCQLLGCDNIPSNVKDHFPPYLLTKNRSGKRYGLPADAAVVDEQGLVRFFDAKNTTNAGIELDFFLSERTEEQRRLLQHLFAKLHYVAVWLGRVNAGKNPRK